MQHIVRSEDWPVMPVETLRVTLKPVNFFEGNPALDVPPSEQAFNRSVQVEAQAEKHLQPGVEGKADGCCNSAGPTVKL